MAVSILEPEHFYFEPQLISRDHRFSEFCLINLAQKKYFFFWIMDRIVDQKTSGLGKSFKDESFTIVLS